MESSCLHLCLTTLSICKTDSSVAVQLNSATGAGSEAGGIVI
ncbi:hypothetical protein X801_00272, partial [Opisthorchis viverrini]